MSGIVAWGGFALLRPWWLLALLPLGLVLVSTLVRRRGRFGGWHAAVDAHLQATVLTEASRDRTPLLLLAALVLVVVALAGPARLKEGSDIAYRSAAARILVVDLSPAMDDADWSPTRSERVRLKLLDLLRALPDGQTGLLVYGEEPYLVAPLTTDTATIAMLVPELDSTAVPGAGNEPIRALRMALALLSRSGSAVRDLIWITGLPNPPADAAVALKDRAGTRVSVLHVAPARGAGFEQLAGASGGTYSLVRSDDADVRALAARLGQQETWVAEQKPSAENIVDLGPWVLSLLLPLAALTFRRGFLVLAALCIVSGLGIPSSSAASESSKAAKRDRDAYRLLTKGDAASAAQSFTDPRWRGAAWYRAGNYPEAARMFAGQSDADGHYNRGNALAKLGDLKGALAAYEQSLALRPTDADTVHNRELIRALLNQQDPPTGSPPSSPPPPRPDGRKPRQDQGGPPPPLAATDREREADSLAEQLMRRTPDEPAGLLKRKLRIEHQRRQANSGARPWE
jgi:Ca-activated chloride channel homolog